MVFSGNLKGDRNKSCAEASLWNVPTAFNVVSNLISRKSCFELNVALSLMDLMVKFHPEAVSNMTATIPLL